MTLLPHISRAKRQKEKFPDLETTTGRKTSPYGRNENVCTMRCFMTTTGGAFDDDAVFIALPAPTKWLSKTEKLIEKLFDEVWKLKIAGAYFII